MTRLTHIMLLLLSLAVIVRIGMGEPGLLVEKAIPTDQEKDQAEVLGKTGFNPQAPSPLPDLNVGYIFLEARELVESDFYAFNKGGEADKPTVSTVDLEEVLYSGSIIIGDLRKALVTYPLAQKSVKRGARGRSKARTVMKHEQLDQGGEFMGFLVASVEEDRIVFERDGERVEKFLHDQNKDRIVVKKQATKPASGRRAKAAAKAPAVARSAPKTLPTSVPRRAVTTEPAVTTAPKKPEPPKDLPKRRSQRLLRGMMPSTATSSSVN